MALTRGQTVGGLLTCGALLLGSTAKSCRTPEAASSNDASDTAAPSDLQPLAVPVSSSAAGTSRPLPLPEQMAGWVARPGSDGTLTLSFAFGEVIRSHYGFWGKGWNWAPAEMSQLEGAEGFPRFRAKVGDLGLLVDGTFAKAGEQELVVSYQVTATNSMQGITGGGIEFNIDPRALAEPPNKQPKLLEKNRGWVWPVTPTDEIRVTFDPPIGRIYFERNDPHQIRCFLVAGDIERGSRKITMRIRLPEGGRALPPSDYYYGPSDGPDWMPQTLDPGVSPVDVSFLNDGDRPAGKHGRLAARGDALVFADGTPARFWGTNLTAGALFGGSKADIQREAKRIAALGYNLVRIHHHDSAWVTPNVFAPGSTTRALNENALETLDWWIKCLRDEGIYTWIDLHVGRKFRAGDSVDGFEELERGNPKGLGFLYVNPSIEKLWREFARSYVTRKNRYTGLSLVEDRSIVAFLITNENDLTHHFGNAMLPDKNNPFHQRLFETLAKRFATEAHLPLPASLHTWKPGPSKIVLNELEHRFAQRSVSYLRRLGVRALVATTNTWGNNPLFSLPALTTGDIIDVHSYGEAEFLGSSPRVAPSFVSWIAAAQVAGHPLAITEWNVPPPARDRFVAPLYVASLSALQGWDMPMLYAYQQYSVDARPDRPDQWSSSIDPALTALMPAAAIMVRQGHVRQAKRTYRLDLSRQQLYDQNLTPETSATIRTLTEQSRLFIGLPDIEELDWDGGANPSAANQVVVTDVDRDFIPPGATFVESDTGELKRDWAQGVHSIDTPMSQAASGWLGGRTVALSEVAVSLQTPKASVALTSLDSKPILRSESMLLTTVAQITTSADGRLPFRAQPVLGTVRVRSEHAGLCAYPTATDGQLFDPIPLSVTDGVAEFVLPKGFRTHWYAIYPQSAGRCEKRARFTAVPSGNPLR